VQHLLSNQTAPLVVDADALNAFAGRPQGLRATAGRVTITPHPGEMGRLLGRGADRIQADRPGAALDAARLTGALTILKGAGTLIRGPATGIHVNLTGNPGLATGGTGDVLAGLLAGLLAQGLSHLDAARLAVYLHGHAGDRAAWRGSQAGLCAGALVDELPLAFREIAVR
jgi:NAD(P)H-hydrate epimerase